MNVKAQRRKLKEINDILEDELGVPERRGDGDVLSSLIGTILSQNTNDANSGRAYASLRERFPEWKDVFAADERDIADAIRMGGLANQKSATIKRVLAWLKETRGKLDLDFICAMSSQEVIEMLSQIKGVGLKTILVTLCFACGKDVFPVDTHILRVSKRLGFVPPNASADKTHAILGKLFPRGKAFSLHINLIRFGRMVCHARKPACEECPLIEHCVAYQQQSY